MVKRWVKVFCVTVFLGVLAVHASRGWVFGEKEESDAILFYGNMKFLEDVLSGDDFTDEEWEQMFDRVWEYSGEVKGEFTPVVPEDTILPEGLITLMEEAFYNYGNFEMRGSDNCFYDNRIEELGGEDFILKLEDAYELFPQISDHRDQIEDEHGAYRWIAELYVGVEVPNKCIDIFHLGLIDGRDCYVFSYHVGETNRAIRLYLMERIGDKFVEVSEFGTPSYGKGTIIKYDEKFYYVALKMNNNLKDYDGIILYSLNDDIEKDSLFISYLPEKYIWTSLYQLSDLEDEVKEELDLYMEKIKEEFTPGAYLGDEMHVYYGDEENAPSVEVKTFSIDAGSTAYLVDAANCGRPVYIAKELRCPNCCSQYLDVVIYGRPLHRGAVEEPDIEIDYQGVVQTWFKEICGKMYTCQVYHTSGFKYIFRIILLEDDELTVVRTEMVAPQEKFVVDRGFFSGM